MQAPCKRSQKLGDKITALQQLVSPYGKVSKAPAVLGLVLPMLCTPPICDLHACIEFANLKSICVSETWIRSTSTRVCRRIRRQCSTRQPPASSISTSRSRWADAASASASYWMVMRRLDTSSTQLTVSLRPRFTILFFSCRFWLPPTLNLVLQRHSR